MTDNAPSSELDRTLLYGAAAASVAAGLVHAATAGSHTGDRTLVVLFASCALAQAGWAGLVALWPSRVVAAGGAVLHLTALLAWVASRTTGLPLVESLSEPESVGLQDLVAASLALAALLASLLALVRRRRPTLASPVWSIAALVIVGLVAAPAVAAEHTHGADHAEHADTDHADTDHADTESADTDHADTESADTDHADTESADADHGDGGHEHHDVPARLDHEPTEDQLAAAQQLIDQTMQSTVGYADVQMAIDAGYRSIGDGAAGYEHFVNPVYTVSSTVLDPAEPESLVYRVLPDGGRELTTVMYVLPPGSTMDDVPDIAGNLTVWHTHDNLCFAPGTTRLAGVLVGGECRPAGVHRPTAPMLHVWVVPNDCGPFAGTDRGQTTGSCIGGEEL